MCVGGDVTCETKLPVFVCTPDVLDLAVLVQATLCVRKAKCLLALVLCLENRIRDKIS